MRSFVLPLLAVMIAIPTGARAQDKPGILRSLGNVIMTGGYEIKHASPAGLTLSAGVGKSFFLRLPGELAGETQLTSPVHFYGSDVQVMRTVNGDVRAVTIKVQDLKSPNLNADELTYEITRDAGSCKGVQVVHRKLLTSEGSGLRDDVKGPEYRETRAQLKCDEVFKSPTGSKAGSFPTKGDQIAGGPAN